MKKIWKRTSDIFVNWFPFEAKRSQTPQIDDSSKKYVPLGIATKLQLV